MRSYGTHRGNAVLRAAIEQSRRRLESLHLDDDPGAGEPPGAGLRYTRAFFDRIREHVLPRMAPAMQVDGAELRYFGADDLALWSLESAHGVVIAYDCADTPALLTERARRWLGCLRTRTAPGMLDRTWGRPVYGARHDRANDALEVVWAKPGDWCGFVLADAPGPRRFSAPPHWQPANAAG